jgi:hypothetical protein
MPKKKPTTEAPVKKKRKGDPKKGSAFERDFARKLSLWWSEGKADDWFWRLGGSGGRATNRAKSGRNTANGYGDIAAQCPEAQKLLNIVTFELKRGFNRISIQDLLDKPNGPNQMRDFIEQAKRSASLAGTPFWVLVFRRDLREELIVTNMERKEFDTAFVWLDSLTPPFDAIYVFRGSQFWDEGRRSELQTEAANHYALYGVPQ